MARRKLNVGKNKTKAAAKRNMRRVAQNNDIDNTHRITTVGSEKLRSLLAGVSMTKHYVLDEDKNVVEADALQHAEFFASDERMIARTSVGSGWAEVSTVFIGLDHVLFEVMVFGGGEHDGQHWRYDTCDRALNFHDQMVERLRHEYTQMQHNIARGGRFV